MTPATETRDRYIFDGEAPFGIAVNQVPPTGAATHFQHGVSADLANLNSGENYDFAYSLRDGYKDTITTFALGTVVLGWLFRSCLLFFLISVKKSPSVGLNML